MLSSKRFIYLKEFEYELRNNCTFPWRTLITRDKDDNITSVSSLFDDIIYEDISYNMIIHEGNLTGEPNRALKGMYIEKDKEFYIMIYNPIFYN